MKRLLAVLLTLMMCVSLLAGCGDGKATETKAPETAAPSENAGEVTQETEEKSLINFDEDPYEVVIESLTLGQEMADLAMVEEAINAITLPAINCTVKLMNLHIADHVTKLSLMAAGGEKVDVVTTGRTYSYPSMVSDGLLLPLDELLAERGQGVLEEVGSAIEATRVGEYLYSIPGQYQAYTTVGIIYNKEMADEYGITVPEMPTIDDIEAIAAQLKEANPDIYLMSKGDGTTDMTISSFYPEIHVFGNNAMYGAMNRDDAEMKLFNLYKSEEYRTYLHKCREWYEKGYVPADSMTSGVNVRDVMMTGQAFMEFGTTSPVQLGILQPQYDFELALEPMVEAKLDTTSLQENGWGIFVNCERPDKAMDFLNLMYTNDDLANVLLCGIEGVHYEKVSDQIIKYPEGVNPGNVGYTRIFSNFGDLLNTYQWEPVTEAQIEECREIAANAKPGVGFGYVFDSTSMATQISNVTNIITEYLPPLVVGIYEDAEIDAQLDKMIEELDAAGMEEIIAENQRQIDAWKAAQ